MDHVHDRRASGEPVLDREQEGRVRAGRGGLGDGVRDEWVEDLLSVCWHHWVQYMCMMRDVYASPDRYPRCPMVIKACVINCMIDDRC